MNSAGMTPSDQLSQIKSGLASLNNSPSTITPDALLGMVKLFDKLHDELFDKERNYKSFKNVNICDYLSACKQIHALLEKNHEMFKPEKKKSKYRMYDVSYEIAKQALTLVLCIMEKEGLTNGMDKVREIIIIAGDTPLDEADYVTRLENLINFSKDELDKVTDEKQRMFFETISKLNISDPDCLANLDRQRGNFFAFPQLSKILEYLRVSTLPFIIIDANQMQFGLVVHELSVIKEKLEGNHLMGARPQESINKLEAITNLSEILSYSKSASNDKNIQQNIIAALKVFTSMDGLESGEKSKRLKEIADNLKQNPSKEVTPRQANSFFNRPREKSGVANVTRNEKLGPGGKL